ncbi:hypothetical protein [Hydrogenovibrio kuenenii]|uniref:hypothetical protein n=1 Tax=Hydrogenovibrio kuenenii TaxID=63658 RepID=UPI0004664CEE|nr:hypothetical protein [Hydrogenovibrio kuenenii]
MCVGVVVGLALLLLYYTDVVISDLSLNEQVGSQYVTIASGWGMATELWPLMLLSALVGIALLLMFLKIKKVL